MAWTVAINRKYNDGPLRVHVLSCTADAATFNVVTGLKVVDHFLVGVQSASAGKIYANKGAIGTSIAGVLGCSGFASGDVLFIKVFGV